MSGIATRIGERRGRTNWGTTGTAGFAMKMVGIGLCAGLGLCCCQFLIETFFQAIR